MWGKCRILYKVLKKHKKRKKIKILKSAFSFPKMTFMENPSISLMACQNGQYSKNITENSIQLLVGLVSFGTIKMQDNI